MFYLACVYKFYFFFFVACLVRSLARSLANSTVHSFAETFVTQLDEVARSHNQYSDSLTSMVANGLDNLVKELQRDLTTTNHDASKIDKAWQLQLATMKKAEAHYKAAALEADAKHDAFVAGKADADMKPKELTNLSQKSTQAAEKRDKVLADYKRTLHLTNQAKTVYWCQDVPALLRRYQAHEEHRISETKKVVEALGHAFLYKVFIYIVYWFVSI